MNQNQKPETIENYEESDGPMEKSIKTWGESTSLIKKSHSCNEDGQFSTLGMEM